MRPAHAHRHWHKYIQWRGSAEAYKATDPGIMISTYYSVPTSYTAPGYEIVTCWREWSFQSWYIDEKLR